MAANQRKCSSWALAVTPDDKSSSAVVEPVADVDAKTSSFTPSPNTTCRCRHLEECMFPRYLNLDAKQMDNFSMKKVHPELLGGNAARLYIESLHLKPFMKDEETLMLEQSSKTKENQGHHTTPKRPCLPLRRNSPDSKRISCDGSTNQDNDEEVLTDRSILSQMYFGGFEAKRACYLSNNYDRETLSGVAGSYHKQLVPNATILSFVEVVPKHSKTMSTSSEPKLPPNEDFKRVLLSEKRLTKLRNQLKLHNRLDLLDNFVMNDPSDNPPKEDVDFKRLQGLIKPISGYIPPDSHAAKCTKDKVSVSQNIRDSTVLGTSSSTSETAPDTNIQTPKTILKRKGPNSLEVSPQQISVDSSPNMAKTARKTIGMSTSKNASTSHDSLYTHVVQEGKDQSLAANLLLDAFRSSRRRYMSREDFKCAWCSSSNKDDKSGYKCCAGDTLMQCLECNLIGCGSSLSDKDCGNQHIMLHFLLSGHRYGVSCGPIGELFCMGCSSFIHQECFDQERERLFIEFNYPSLSWQPKQILRGVDASSFVMVPEQGYVWRGLKATYPVPIASNLVSAAQSAAKRLSIFRGHIGERTVQWGPKSVELSLYIREHLRNRMITTPVGLYNMGNTCFISSVLHCLINCEPLENFFLLDLIHPYQSCEALRGDKGCLACELDRAFLEYFGSANGIDAIAALEEHELSASSLPRTRFLYDKSTTTYTKKRDKEFCGHPLILSSFLAETWKHVGMKQLAGQNQNDAQEFFSSFVNALISSDVDYRNASSKLKERSRPTQINQSAMAETKLATHERASTIKGVFIGSMRSILICQRCHAKRTQVEPFINVSLPFTKGESKNTVVEVEHCLDHFTNSESLVDLVHCPACEQPTKSTQQQAFASLPEVLCLHLKRFDSRTNKKLTDTVSFPSRGLDMGKYLAQWCQATKSTTPDENERPKILYDVFATVNHNGFIDKGHYTANILKGGSWYTINDEFVSEAVNDNWGNENEVLCSDTAYMLFYLRRK